MAGTLTISGEQLDALFRNPGGSVGGRVGGEAGGQRFVARIALADYAGTIARHYGVEDLDALCRRAGLPSPLRHFGLICAFEDPAELRLHDEALVLDDGLREAFDRLGPVFISNACLDGASRKQEQRNIFPHLSFHFDRGHNQPRQISLFTRDPHDPEQAEPRRSSTVFIANIVAWLQRRRESGDGSFDETGLRTPYEIFHNETMADVMGGVVLEHPWSAPRGSGEICLFDNRTLLHASYYRERDHKGYRIGVRYVD